MAKKRAVQRDSVRSVAAKIEAFQAAQDDVPIPRGITFNSPEAHMLWEEFTLTRAPADWTTGALIQLVKVTKLEAEIRAIQRHIDVEGVMDPDNPRKPNPLLKTRSGLQAEQNAMMRMMGLVLPDEPEQRSARATAVRDARSTLGRPNFQLLAGRNG